MGNDESLPQGAYFPAEFDPPQNADNGHRTFIKSLPSNFNHPFSPLLDLGEEVKEPPKVYKAIFGGTWSIELPDSLSPICRKGHFCVYSKYLKKIYIGYGIESKQEPKFLNDVWEFCLTTRKWNHVNLKYNDNSTLKRITTRKNSSATISEKDMKLYIFGGIDQSGMLLSDFHSIDLQTGEIQIITPNKNTLSVDQYNTESEQYSNILPHSRRGAVLQFYNGKIYMWGGMTTEATILNEISIYDFSQNIWTTRIFQKPKKQKNNNNSETANGANSWVEGRYNLPWQLVDNHIYCYGASPRKTLIDIEIPANSHSLIEELRLISIREIECIGSSPPEDTFYAGMVFVDSNFNVNGEKINGRHGLLAYLGGRSYSRYTLIYALDLARMWWFVLHVSPDGDSCKYSDGKISENGLFMTPRFYNFGLGYDERRREIVACAGHQGIISKNKGERTLTKADSNKVIPTRKRRVTDLNDKNGEMEFCPVKGKETHSPVRRYSNIVIADEVNTYLFSNNSQEIASNPKNKTENLHLVNNSFDNSSSSYYGKENRNKIQHFDSGLGAMQAGEKLFVFGIANVIAGLNIKEDLLNMQKLTLKFSEEENNMLDNGEEKIIDIE